MDGEGRAATYTGADCQDWAGGRVGDGYAAQGNILVSAETVDALAETFESSAGRPLVERLLDCLDAAQAAGGDRRGQQSAAILVVGPEQGFAGLSDVFVDLRVDDHERPLEELRRIFAIHQELFPTPVEEVSAGMKITNLEVPGYERVARAEDEASGLRAFISVHSTRLGPSLGGMRLWPYATDDAALEDVLRLSRAMTYKSAVAGTGLGGGKSVVIADPSQKTDELFEAMGRFVDDFGGTYITAEDVNVGIPDLRSVQRTTSHVTGLTVEEGGGGNPRAATALGCFLGVGAALLEASGSSDVAGKTAAVQGLGSVGFALAEHLTDAGARVLATDVNPERIEHAVSRARGRGRRLRRRSTASSATSSRRARSAASSTTTRSHGSAAPSSRERRTTSSSTRSGTARCCASAGSSTRPTT